jgi:hypothetical protein
MVLESISFLFRKKISMLHPHIEELILMDIINGIDIDGCHYWILMDIINGVDIDGGH